MTFARFFSDVAEFHREMGFAPFADIKSETMVEHNGERMAFGDAVMRKRCDIVREEAGEFCEALASGDKSKILHEGIDLIYVTLGGLLEAGVTWAELSVGWSLVQIANLGKEPPSSPLSKAVKGERFKVADVSKALGAEDEVHVYGVVCGADENAKVTIINTIGPMDRAYFLGLIRDSAEAGRLPTLIQRLL